MTKVVNGSDQAMRPGKYAPAQNTRPYTALKFGGISPGHRVAAKTIINKIARAGFQFAFMSMTLTGTKQKDKDARLRVVPHDARMALE